VICVLFLPELGQFGVIFMAKKLDIREDYLAGDSSFWTGCRQGEILRDSLLTEENDSYRSLRRID
jgi:hypothetical protein